MKTQAAISVPPAIGFIVPSSNRIVERATRTILAAVPGADACFARVPYDGHPEDGYDIVPFEAAAAMLKEARVDAICWNATRGALLDFEPDSALCRLLKDRTGLPVVTTALATLELLKAGNLTRIGLLAQGNREEGDRLIGNLSRRGIQVAAAHHLGIRDNFEASRVPRDDIACLVKDLAVNAGTDAVLIWSTNLPGFELAPEVWHGLGIPVLDSATIGVQAALAAAGIRLDRAEEFGMVHGRRTGSEHGPAEDEMMAEAPRATRLAPSSADYE